MKFNKMSGHSRWSQIKHKKEVSDQKRGQLFSKLARVISMAAVDGIDPASNPHLQAAIDRARSFNMPNENIARAVKRASEKDAAALYEVLIQAMASNGSIALVIKAITDNKNRTISEVKNILIKAGAKIVPENSLNWMFIHNWAPITPIRIADEAARGAVEGLIEELLGHDDVEEIYSNLD